MGRINSLGIDALMDDLAKEAAAIPKCKKKMCEEGAKILEDEMRNQIDAMDIYETGATFWAIKHRFINDSAVEVWPAGTRIDKKHPHGERAETVAFVAEYGTKSTPARPFMSTAVEIAADKVVQKMMEVLQNERGR